MKALPNLNKLIYESAKVVESPHASEIAEGRRTLYDTWAKRRPKKGQPGNIPDIPTLGSGSDFTAFVQVTGITASSVSYDRDTRVNVRSYPVYHSVYETFDLVKKFVDPGFKFCKAVAQLTAEMIRRLADDPVLPLNYKDYAARLKEDKEEFAKVFGKMMADHEIDLNHFDYALKNFSAAAEEIHQRIDNLDTTNEFQLRAINDQLMQLDRAFIDMNGIGERINFRHVIYAPSLHDTYASSAFPGLSDSLFDIEADGDQEGRWREVKRQYSILLYHIGSAASTLRDFAPVKGYSNY